jgi:hypothetical protein
MENNTIEHNGRIAVLKTIKVYPEKQAEYRKRYYERIKNSDQYKQVVSKAKREYYLKHAEEIKEKRRMHYQKMKELKKNKSLEIESESET